MFAYVLYVCLVLPKFQRLLDHLESELLVDVDPYVGAGNPDSLEEQGVFLTAALSLKSPSSPSASTKEIPVLMFLFLSTHTH